MKQIERTITTYDAGEGFYIDIVSIPEKDLLIEAWIYHEDYGTKELMFAVEHELIDTFVDMVKNNLPEYIDDYKDIHFD